MSETRDNLLDFRRETLVDRLVHLLQESIYSGKYPPKAMISEGGVAKEFGVGRVPAREALLRLEEMNLVRKNHLRREIVKLSPEEFADLYELKIAIEGFAVVKGSRLAGRQEIIAIEKMLNGMEQATVQGSLVQRRNFNHRFHELLVSSSKNQKLIDAYLPLSRQLRWTSSLILKQPDRQVESNREHREIFIAFQEKKTAKLRKLIEKHSNDHMDRISALMELDE